MYSIFDILYVLQIIFTFTMIRLFLLLPAQSAEDFEFISNLFRKVGVFGTICLFLKASYFLSLLDPVAPLVDIIFQIFFDMKYFVLVLLILTFMIALCFQLIASLQIDFDNISEEDLEATPIPYMTIKPAIWYGVQFMFGGASSDPFFLGDAKQANLLEGLYFFANFLIVLHLLNMLIAIMGSTFGNREEVGHLIMKRDHLRFVMDNWILLHIAFFRKLNDLEFLIAALPLADSNDDEADLNTFYEEF